MGHQRRVKGEGSIHQLADGRWRAQIDLGWRNGKRYRPIAYAATAREAADELKELRQRSDEGTLPLPGEKITVERWMLHWLHNIAKTKVRESTWQRAYRPYVEGHIIPALGRVRLDRLDEDQIEAFYADLGAKRSAATVLQVHRILSRAMKVAMMRRRLSRNPCQAVNPPSYQRPEIAPPSIEECRLLLDHAREQRNGARWALALALGLRQGEALGLLWTMVDLDDLDHASLRVSYELARVRWQHGCDERRPGEVSPLPRRASRLSQRVDSEESTRSYTCGRTARCCPQRRGGGLVLVPPKSQRSKRDVALPRPVAELLKRHRQAQRKERIAAGTAWRGWRHDCDRKPRRGEIVCPSCRRPIDQPLVFGRPDGSAIDPRRDWGEWKGMLDDLDLPGYRVHDARHFAASLLLEEGIDVRVVQEILGHSSSTLTRDTYQHVTKRLHGDAASRTGRALFGSLKDSQTAPNIRDQRRENADVRDLKKRGPELRPPHVHGHSRFSAYFTSEDS